MALRGYLAVYVNLRWAFGQLISAGVQSAFSGGTTQWSYRSPFAIQWSWPIPLFLIVFFASEPFGIMSVLATSTWRKR